MNLKTINPELAARLVAKISEECSVFDIEAAFDDCLDECYSFKDVGGPFACMTPSRVLREIDPTAHRCGANDYADSLSKDGEITEINGDWFRTEEAEVARSELVDELRQEAKDSAEEGEEPDERDAYAVEAADLSDL